MPKQSWGFWACIYCDYKFDSYEEASYHEAEKCVQAQRQQHHHHHPGSSVAATASGNQGGGGGGGGGSMAPLSLAEANHSEASFEYEYRPSRQRGLPLMRPSEGSPLSEGDTVACRSLELFEMGEHDLDISERHQPAMGQVGLRCCYCAGKTSTSDRYDFPPNLLQVGTSVRRIAELHLPKCQAAPPNVNALMQNLSQQRKRTMQEQSQRQQEGGRGGSQAWVEEENSRRFLMEFCTHRCQQMGLMNKYPEGTGIAFSEPANSEGAGETRVVLAGFDGQPPLHPGMAMSAAAPSASSARSSPRLAGGESKEEVSYMGRGRGGGGGSSPSVSRRLSPSDPASGMASPYEPTFGPGMTFVAEAEGPAAPQHLSHLQHHPQFPQQLSHQHPQLSHQNHQHHHHAMNAEGVGGGAPQARYAGNRPMHSQVSLNFPFFQDATTGDWLCKFCSHVPLPYRDQHHVWSVMQKSPPPPDFIEYHLSACREYSRGRYYPSSATAGPQTLPPMPGDYSPGRPTSSFGGSYGGGRPGSTTPVTFGSTQPSWESPSGNGPRPSAPVMQQQQQQQQQRTNHAPSSRPASAAYARLPTSPPSSSLLGESLADQHATRYMERPPSKSNPTPQQPPPAPPPARGRPAPVVQGEQDANVTRAINYLINNDKSIYETDGSPVPMESRLVLEEDKLLLTDYFFYLMKQLRLVRFSEADRRTRGGKREKIQVGYGGLQCVHCADAQNSRKFFWSNVDRLANSFAEIPGHVLKCRRCPKPVKDALVLLKQLHPEQMARLPRGSQKVFFRRMWRRLHDEDPAARGATSTTGSSDSPHSSQHQRQLSEAHSVETEGSTAASATQQAMGIHHATSRNEDRKPAPLHTKTSASEHSPEGTSGSDESILVVERSTASAAKTLADSLHHMRPPSPSSRVLLAIPDDKQWLSDTDCFIRRQIEVFCATLDDVDVARADRKYPVHEGQVGIRCIHCALSKRGSGAKGQGVAYPFAISGIYESVREFQRLHLDNCANLPPAVSSKLADLKGSSSLSSVLRKYYILAAKALGLHDTRDGIRAGGQSMPLGSQAAFAFSERKGSRVGSPEHKNAASSGHSPSPSLVRAAGMVPEHSGLGMMAEASSSLSSSPIPFAPSTLGRQQSSENPKKRHVDSQGSSSPDSRKSSRSSYSEKGPNDTMPSS